MSSLLDGHKGQLETASVICKDSFKFRSDL